MIEGFLCVIKVKKELYFSRKYLYFLCEKSYTIDNNIEHIFVFKERRKMYE